MRKMVLLAFVAVLGLGSVAAQQRNGGRPRMSVEEQVNRLKNELKLTDEQTKKVTALYTDFQKKQDEKSKDEQPSREQMRSEREKLNKEIESLLTDEQKKTFKQMQNRQRGGGRGR